MLIPRVAKNENETVARQKVIKLSFINKQTLGEKIKNFNNFPALKSVTQIGLDGVFKQNRELKSYSKHF
jgi:hypothetical protein